ncbi:hypothetical protein BT67DRAFT_457869 [Trichocladium antarcticum]|uniref:Uncharacterized protein n=1 Tax=Trichocladium antarcticum TaxID=1450529 RepID=A0AAN6UFB4_9PEZI|nr:hypothetical protein BT67DRAFT_457869 [Trichocladium antarcticum]
MLSHLRFHRRPPSNPPSPLPDQAPAAHVWDAAAQHEHPQSARDVSPHPDAPSRSPNLSSLPPTLPLTARLASTGTDHLGTPPDKTPPPPRPSHDGETSTGTGFLGGLALHNYRRATHASQSDSTVAMAGQLPETQLSRAKSPPPPINTGLAARPAMTATHQTKSSSFITPTDIQQGSGGATTKRPSKTRLASEPAPVAAPGPAPEPQKGRKGLPFLKNPMTSLLMRRKTGNSANETKASAPIYDPRIRGTRVHDFSAPRPKKTISGDAMATPTTEGTFAAASTCPPRPSAGPGLGTEMPERPVLPVPPKDEPATNLRSSSSAASRDSQVTPRPPGGSASVRTVASRTLSVLGTSVRDSVASAIPKHMKSTSSRFSFDMAGAAKEEKLLEERHRQREQEKKTSDDPSYSDVKFDDFDEDFDYDAMMDDDGLEERIPGVNADYEDEYPADDTDPDNDQENFAGFSFQRSNPASSLASPLVLATPRDADGKAIGFAMTQDTTPEPTSASSMFPGPLAVPKPNSTPGLDTRGPETDTVNGPEPLFTPRSPATAEGPDSLAPAPGRSDDIYFDDGLADELDFEPDGLVFDESIFDNHDTDQYGRPIPGAFAQAQDAMRAAQQHHTNRDSDITSDLSGQTGVTESTGHTSLSVAAQLPPAPESLERPSSWKQPSTGVPPSMDIAGQDLAYQAALAEAAQKAAVLGRFGRDSPDEVSGTADIPLTDSADFQNSPPDAHLEVYEKDDLANDLDNYEDDDYGNDLDDFDFDDEAIIAEANASALANDADGFYGQEFGFYSAPLAHHPAHGGGSGGGGGGGGGSAHHQPSPDNPAAVTPETFYGGYFGPAGGGAINRSTSGRVVCREPNLTPITERSEYSNRNSVMSFTLPPAIGSNEPGAGGGGRNSVSGPGLAALAQLALLEGEAAESMSLEALMRLRSRAWGGAGGSGSQGGSRGSSREGSPRSERVVPAAAVGAAVGDLGFVGQGGFGHARVHSGLSLWSGSDPGGGGGSGGSGSASPVLGHAALVLANGTGAGAGAGAGAGSAPLAALPWLGPGSLPPRPGSAGAVPTNGLGVFAPPPPRPHSLFLPPIPGPAPVPVPSSPGQQLNGGGACSPVWEGEEAEDGAACPLAPALPLRTASPVQVLDGGGREHQFAGDLVARAEQQVLPCRPGMGHKHKGWAESVSYVKDGESRGDRWVVERRWTAESGEVEILGRAVVDGGRI